MLFFVNFFIFLLLFGVKVELFWDWVIEDGSD